MVKECKNCRYYEKCTEENENGEYITVYNCDGYCNRYPPKLVNGGSYIPEVGENSWCGEWKLKDQWRNDE